MKLAAVLIALLASGSVLTGAAAMQWDHFRRSTNIEDRTTRSALVQPLEPILWWRLDGRSESKMVYYAR